MCNRFTLCIASKQILLQQGCCENCLTLDQNGIFLFSQYFDFPAHHWKLARLPKWIILFTKNYPVYHGAGKRLVWHFCCGKAIRKSRKKNWEYHNTAVGPHSAHLVKFSSGLSTAGLLFSTGGSTSSQGGSPTHSLSGQRKRAWQGLRQVSDDVIL